uniref:Uncharacterized protein n=1 Tax=Elaeophora elaphi TaxID=1147741 RepID=A0A0R3RYR8_9BILA
MLGFQPQSSTWRSPLFHQKNEDGFELGHFDRYCNGRGEIVSSDGLRYVFGPESIDLGPCCNPCDENWKKVFKNEDVLVFSRGYTHFYANRFLGTAKQVIIPETQRNHSFLGVVLRERHPSSTEGATAAFLCPPFGIIKLHKFAFGYDSDFLWPPKVGSRFWVTLDDIKSSTRVWKVDGRADDAEFGFGSTLTDIPKLHLWQWNKTFNESGIFAITDFVLKRTESAMSLKEIESFRGSSTMSTSVEAQSCERNEIGNSTNVQTNNAAISLLLEILNDQCIRDLVVERHQKAFENYIIEMSHP